MSAKRDYYDVLGIDRTADKNTIKKAYRKLAKRYHPDTNKDNPQAEEKFQGSNRSLQCPQRSGKKKMYDQFGHAAFDGTAGAGGSGAYGYADRVEEHIRTVIRMAPSMSIILKAEIWETWMIS